nr:MAG TPA: hypothetical protein [Caudoviricetes sp.]
MEECIKVKAKFVNPRASLWFTEGGIYALQESPLDRTWVVTDDDSELWFVTPQLDGTWKVDGTYTHAVFERVEE